MKIELIKWVDTFGCSQGWEFEDEIERRVITVSSVGFVREETEKYVWLIPHISNAEGHRLPAASAFLVGKLLSGLNLLILRAKPQIGTICP